ncbi:MAG: transposase, partial [Bacteroidota bacterium]|nr:transposase [Bacteroidota bacterium]
LNHRKNGLNLRKKSVTVLFLLYADVQTGYSLTHSLQMIFSKNYHKSVAHTKVARWYNDVSELEFKSFNTIAATIYSHYQNILNFFENRSINASAESFNA